MPGVIFKSIFMSVVDVCAPVKEVRLKQKSKRCFSSNIVWSIYKGELKGYRVSAFQNT